MDPGYPVAVYFDETMPKLVVQPPKSKSVLKIIFSQFRDVAGYMQRLTRLSIITYVKMDFQILYEQSANLSEFSECVFCIIFA